MAANNSLPILPLHDSLPLQDSYEETITPGEPDIEWNGLSLDGDHEGLEHLPDYETGGHHPVHLNDLLGSDDRYRVIHKLGNGGFGNVWLCRDLKFDDASPSNKYCALKILMADISTDDPPEVQMHRDLKSLLDNSGGEEGAQFICLPFDHFSIEGPNGSHYCFAYPVLGPRASSFNSSLFANPDEFLRGLCEQSVQALQFLHSHDICHGDFTPSNILLTLSGLEDLTEQALLSLLGPPKKVPAIYYHSGLPSSDGKAPHYLVRSIDWDIAGPKLIDPHSTRIKLIDFGESYKVSNPPEDLGIPGSYKAPELLISQPSTATSTSTGKVCDLWALGCTLFEIRTGRKLFSSYDNEADDYLVEIALILGKFPGEWWEKTWVNRKKYFRDGVEGVVYMDGLTCEPKMGERGGVVSRVHPAVAQGARSLSEKLRPGVWHLCASFDVHREIGEGEIGVFVDLLGGLLRYAPGERMQVGQVLNHEWFKMALPEPVILRGPWM